MKKLEISLPQPTGLWSTSENSIARHQSSQANYATERARLLFGQYRRGDANDPVVYVASVAAILADYPADTIRYVTDPRTGIAGNPINPNWTGLPDTADVKRACERHYGPMRRAINTEGAIHRQFAEREKMAIGDRSKRPTYEELVRRCNKTGLMIGQPKHRSPPMKPANIMAKYNIRQEEWDKIPNRSQDDGF